MLVYRCEMCSRVSTFFSVPIALYCRWCGGTLILHDEEDDPSRASDKNVFDSTEDATRDNDFALIKKSRDEAFEYLMAQLDRLASKMGVIEDPRALRWLRILGEHPRLLILGAQGMGNYVKFLLM